VLLIIVQLSPPPPGSIILSSNKIQNVDILVLAYHSCPEKWLLNEHCASLQIEVVFIITWQWCEQDQ